MQFMFRASLLLICCFAAFDAVVTRAPAQCYPGLGDCNSNSEPWMAPLKDADRGRIGRIVKTREQALAKGARGDASLLRSITEILRAPTHPITVKELEGRWRCRTFYLPSVAWGDFFDCRIRQLFDQTIAFEKLSGSVHINARLDPIDDRTFLFYGAYWPADDPPKTYASGDPYFDQVGILGAIAADQLRLELPEPRDYNTALHEVIQLLRAR